MTNRFLTFFTLFAVLLSMPMTAQAQTCSYQRDLIFEIRDGQIGAYSVWDAVYGDVDHVEAFSSAVNAGAADTLVVGARIVNNQKELLLVKYDYRGRVLWEKTHQVSALRDVVKILPTGSSYLVLANVGAKGKANKAWTGVFNERGDLLRKTGIVHGNRSLVATDIMPMRIRKGFVMVANAQDSSGKTNSMLYFLNTKGQVIRNRAYLTGPENKLHGISEAGEDGYLLTGEIETGDNRHAGWVARISRDGTMLWQQQYVRGVYSALHASHPYKKGYFIVSGYSDPHQTRQAPLKRAGWVMALDANNGDLAWQRYYRGLYAYTARDVSVSVDGLISVMLDGDWQAPDLKKNPAAYNPATDLGERKDIDYVSLLTIDPRGTLLFNDSYYFAQGSHAQQMFLTAKAQRALVGSTKTLYQHEQAEEGDPLDKPKAEVNQDAWLYVTPQTEPYTDPCAR